MDYFTTLQCTQAQHLFPAVNHLHDGTRTELKHMTIDYGHGQRSFLHLRRCCTETFRPLQKIEGDEKRCLEMAVETAMTSGSQERAQGLGSRHWRQAR